MSALNEKPYISSEKYLEWERAAETRSEYFDGEIFLMAGGSIEHSTISLNVGSELRNQLKGKSCRAFESNMKIAVPEMRWFAYPDASVVCGEPLFRDDQRDVILNPTLIVEVLSPSTESFDRGKKFARYQCLESFTDYLLIAQDEPRVEHFVRQANGVWLLTITEGIDKQISLPAIACRLLMREMYDRVEFVVKRNVAGKRRKPQTTASRKPTKLKKR